jgi:hypothetical protein
MRYAIVKHNKVTHFVEYDKDNYPILAQGELCLLDKNSLQIGDSVYLNGEIIHSQDESSNLAYWAIGAAAAGAGALGYLFYF